VKGPSIKAMGRKLKREGKSKRKGTLKEGAVENEAKESDGPKTIQA